MPADGLFSAGFSRDIYNTTYSGTSQATYSNSKLKVGYSVFNWLYFYGHGSYLTWANRPSATPSGSSIGDSKAGVVLGLPTFGNWQGVTISAARSFPNGDHQNGTGEGEASSQFEMTLSHRFWQNDQLPEMTFHLSGGRRINGNESGVNSWWPLYPSAIEPTDNDYTLLSSALQFRKDNVDLFIEYSEARLNNSDMVTRKEWQRCASAGLNWGGHTGWGMSLTYDIPLGVDDLNTEFEPEYPDLITTVSLSKVFGLGGRDRDEDGILDRLDACPNEAEDIDGFEDEDGCPDCDNDQDGILDINDQAPLEAEDIDGWLDDDGIPDYDNDSDGFADINDPCPDHAEDFDGYKDDDGCPEEFPDKDKDGIADEVDDCPLDAEDIDQFEDTDGCPDLDNDLDGIPDAEDKCPDAAEDYDGNEDEDGCPE